MIQYIFRKRSKNGDCLKQMSKIYIHILYLKKVVPYFATSYDDKHDNDDNHVNDDKCCKVRNQTGNALNISQTRTDNENNDTYCLLFVCWL